MKMAQAEHSALLSSLKYKTASKKQGKWIHQDIKISEEAATWEQ